MEKLLLVNYKKMEISNIMIWPRHIWILFYYAKGPEFGYGLGKHSDFHPFRIEKMSNKLGLKLHTRSPTLDRPPDKDMLYSTSGPKVNETGLGTVGPDH